MNQFLQDIVKKYATGGPIVGPGTGTSDSIPATINGTEPAALSDGEYVIKADVVAKAGGGNTEAGFSFFDQLMAFLEQMDAQQSGEFADVMLNIAESILEAGSGGPAANDQILTTVEDPQA